MCAPYNYVKMNVGRVDLRF